MRKVFILMLMFVGIAFGQNVDVDKTKGVIRHKRGDTVIVEIPQKDVKETKDVPDFVKAKKDKAAEILKARADKAKAAKAGKAKVN